MSDHLYEIEVKWTGNKGEGTKDYRSYERSHVISGVGKPDLLGSSDPLFRGDPTKYNPEELLLASLSSCHMLWFLHICADKKINVIEYVDNPKALMVIDPSGKGFFKEATLHPSIVITDRARFDEIEKIHETAHQKCFIANSINFKVLIKPKVTSL
jgi:organic hydroperoxide reductase OsmC/OhrA